MLRKSLAVAMGLILCSVFLTSSSWAKGHKTGDLKGTWYWYVHATEIEDYGSWWVKAVVKVKRNGTIASGTSFETSSGDSGVINGGKLKISSGGIVKGTIEIRVNGEDSETVTIEHAATDKNNSLIIGVMKPDGDSVETFRAVKR